MSISTIKITDKKALDIAREIAAAMDSIPNQVKQIQDEAQKKMDDFLENLIKDIQENQERLRLSLNITAPLLNPSVDTRYIEHGVAFLCYGKSNKPLNEQITLG